MIRLSERDWLWNGRETPLDMGCADTTSKVATARTRARVRLVDSGPVSLHGSTRWQGCSSRTALRPPTLPKRGIMQRSIAAIALSSAAVALRVQSEGSGKARLIEGRPERRAGANAGSFDPGDAHGDGEGDGLRVRRARHHSGWLDDVPSRERRHDAPSPGDRSHRQRQDDGRCRSRTEDARTAAKVDRRSGRPERSRSEGADDRHGEHAAGPLRLSLLRRYAGPRAAHDEGHGSSADRRRRHHASATEPTADLVDDPRRLRVHDERRAEERSPHDQGDEQRSAAARSRRPPHRPGQDAARTSTRSSTHRWAVRRPATRSAESPDWRRATRRTSTSI